MTTALFAMQPAQHPDRAGPACSPSSVCTPSSLHLRERDGVHTVTLHSGQCAELAVAQGCLWLTRDGQVADQVLAAGQAVRVAGPARLRLGALDLETPAGTPQRGCLLHLRRLD